jgi:hypothetical protein
MTALPELVPPTAQAIDAACTARRAREARDDDALRMSSIGHKCDRALWYALRWAHHQKPIDGRIVRIFDNGHARESAIVQYLKDAGFMVVDRDPATRQQFEVVLAGGALVGHFDGIITGIPESPVNPHLLEIKTMNAKRFKEFRAKGIQASDPSYWVQANAYAYAQGLTRILFVVECQDTKAIHTQRLHVDPVAAAGVEARAGRIYAATSAPPRISDDPRWHECLFCASHAICHGGELARRNCRTCLAFDLPRKTCARFGRAMDRDAQRQGCNLHLYEPSLVAAEQIDADEAAGTVTYRKPDGSLWVDGVQS